MFGLETRTMGRISALLSAFFCALMFYYTKKINHSIGQMAVIRGMLNCLICLGHGTYVKEELFGTFEKVKNCSIRGLLAIGCICCMMQANKFLSISVFSILSQLNIFCIIFLSVVYLKRQFSTISLYLGALSFFGMTLVICPYIYGFQKSTDSRSIEFHGTFKEIIGLICTAVFIMGSSFVKVFASKIAKSVGPIQSTFFLSYWLLILGALMCLFDPLKWELAQFWNYVGISVFSYIYQAFFIRALRMEPDPNIITVLQSTVVVFSMGLDYFLNDRSISIVNVVGAGCVTGATIIAAIKKDK